MSNVGVFSTVGGICCYLSSSTVNEHPHSTHGIPHGNHDIPHGIEHTLYVMIKSVVVINSCMLS